MSRDLRAEMQAESDKHHRHHWQPAAMIPGWTSHAANDEGTPNHLVILCGCGAVGRVEVPRGITKNVRPLLPTLAIVAEEAS